MTKRQMRQKENSIESSLIHKALNDQLFFRPTPPGNRLEDDTDGVSLPQRMIEIDASKQELTELLKSLHSGALTIEEINDAIILAGVPSSLRKKLLDSTNKVEHVYKKLLDSTNKVEHVNKKLQDSTNKVEQVNEKLIDAPNKMEKVANGNVLTAVHHLDDLASLAINIISRMHESLLNVEPLLDVRFHFTDTAKAILAVGWEAMLKRGIFPIPPEGPHHIQTLLKKPLGAMHFVSASDLDAGYNYTMGIAFSPEAQSLGTINVSYGLDGELIVPGQAVSPIPPFLAMGTRLFAAKILTSSNISEEVQSIPIRNYPHPTAYNDLKPMRSGIYQPSQSFDTLDHLISDLQQQLWKNTQTEHLSAQDNKRFIDHHIGNVALPPVKAVFEVTEMTPDKIRYYLNEILKQKDLATHRKEIALYLNIETTSIDRISRINEVVDVAAECGFKYVAVADNAKDEWLPNLLEYLEPYELNAVADHSDMKGIVVIDGRPVDPIYTAATSAQRIQSVYTTLAVDVLKMGMWLCLDALSARMVYRELLNNPHISKRMLLMPIGIVEPWNAFVDNRDNSKTPRAILDPFEKIKFMIEEARILNIPALLTDTRHKETWVLLGRKTPQDEPHPREIFLRDPITHMILSRTEKSAIPLLSWEEFMECERLARDAGIFLGQAGSVETFQLFKIISETTYDAAKEGKNPATGIWTAETERVLSTRNNAGIELQSQRSAAVSPFLAVINRGFESHAKLDGWLRYLNDKNNGNKLRDALQKRRTEINALLELVLEAQTKSNYQEVWNQFRAMYLEYHNLIKTNFLSIRNLVEKTWASHKKKEKSIEYQEE